MEISSFSMFSKGQKGGSSCVGRASDNGLHKRRKRRMDSDTELSKAFQKLDKDFKLHCVVQRFISWFHLLFVLSQNNGGTKTRKWKNTRGELSTKVNNDLDG